METTEGQGSTWREANDKKQKTSKANAFQIGIYFLLHMSYLIVKVFKNKV